MKHPNVCLPEALQTLFFQRTVQNNFPQGPYNIGIIFSILCVKQKCFEGLISIELRNSSKLI